MNNRVGTGSMDKGSMFGFIPRAVVIPLVLIAVGALVTTRTAAIGDGIILVGFVWTTAISLVWALPIYVLFSPFTAGLLFHGHHVAISDAMAFSMAVALLIRHGPERVQGWVRTFFPRPFRWPVLLLLAIAVISLAHAQSHSTALVKILELVEFFVIIVAVAADFEGDGRAWIPTLVGLFAVAVYEALIGLEQFLLGIGPSSFQAFVGHIRAFGSFGQPNVFGAFMADTLPIVLALYLFGPKGRHRPWLLVVSILLALGVWASLSRGAWVADVAAIGLMGIFVWITRGRESMARYAGYAVILPLVLFAVVTALGHIDMSHTALARHLQGKSAVSRAVSIFGSSVDTAQRFYIWKAALHAIRSHPVTGVGMGEFYIWVRSHMPAGLAYPPPHAHDIYLELGADTGVVGIIAILWLQVRWILTSVRLVLGRVGALTDMQFALSLGAVGTFTAFIVQNWVDYMVDHGVIVPLLLMMGFVASLAIRPRVQRTDG
ncbi:MAG: O-antigen ligase family protein [Clostridia bacterium]